MTWVYWQMLQAKTRELFVFLYNFKFCFEYVPKYGNLFALLIQFVHYKLSIESTIKGIKIK